MHRATSKTKLPARLCHTLHCLTLLTWAQSPSPNPNPSHIPSTGIKQEQDFCTYA